MSTYFTSELERKETGVPGGKAVITGSRTGITDDNRQVVESSFYDNTCGGEFAG